MGTMLAALLLFGVPQERVDAPELLSSEDHFRPIGDAALVAIVKRRFDPLSDRRKWPRAIGLHKGVPVVASYRCSDVCPAYTKRIIRYNVRAGAECDRIGGVSKNIVVPMGIGAGPKLYCLPTVTAPYQQ